MKTCFVIIAFAFLSFGCSTTKENAVSIDFSGLPEEKIIYQRLRQEPIPLPVTTPFDLDPKQQEAYLNGFRKAWNYVVSGNFLHATTGASIPDGLEGPWNAGWKDGYKIAGARWMQESEKWHGENALKLNHDPSP